MGRKNKNYYEIDVPYYKAEDNMCCGPLALKMCLEYLGREFSIETISREERQLNTGPVWSAGIARAAKKFGFRTKLISITNFYHEENNIDYYRKYANNNAMIVLKELTDEIKEIGVEIEKRDMPLKELLNFVSDNSVPIVLVNWFILTGKEGFSGHFLPVTGYDEENVYVHNSGMASAMPYLPLKKELFVKAWESKGTDKDVIVIFKN